MVPLIFVAIFMISIFMTSGYLLQSVTEEKENRVVEIVLSSVPATPLMAGQDPGSGWRGFDAGGDLGDHCPGGGAAPVEPGRQTLAPSRSTRSCWCWR